MLLSGFENIDDKILAKQLKDRQLVNVFNLKNESENVKKCRSRTATSAILWPLAAPTEMKLLFPTNTIAHSSSYCCNETELLARRPIYFPLKKYPGRYRYLVRRKLNLLLPCSLCDDKHDRSRFSQAGSRSHALSVLVAPFFVVGTYLRPVLVLLTILLYKLVHYIYLVAALS